MPKRAQRWVCYNRLNGMRYSEIMNSIIPPPSSSFFPCHSCTIRCTHQPSEPSPPKDQFQVAMGSPASPSTPHWTTTKSGRKIPLTRSTMGQMRMNVSADAPALSGTDKVKGSNVGSSTFGREARGETGKKPGAV